MKICLINPKRLGDSDLSIPHGLLQLVSELKHRGHDCDLVDYNNTLVNKPYCLFNRYDLVGFSVMTTQLKHAMEIADSLDKNVIVVWGGVHCLLDPLSILKKYQNHFVISGEGEVPLLKLIEHLEGDRDQDFLKNQTGISYCLNGDPVINTPFFNQDLEKLNDINYYDLPFLETYIKKSNYYFINRSKISQLSILTSRGCSWDCSFCINSIYRKFKAFHRSKTISKIRRETEKIIDDFDVEIVIPADEDFFVNQGLVEDWKKYAEEKKFLWGGSGRFNYFGQNKINEVKLKELVDSGLFLISMSVEAGSEDLRNKILNKRVDEDDIYKAIEIIKNSVGRRIAINTSFIINFPGDNQLNKIETIEWMEFLSRNANVTFSGPQIYRPYPGSRLYDIENKHRYGDIEYYLTNINDAGSFITTENSNAESYFYSRLMQEYFNSRFNFFKLGDTKNQALKYSLARDSIIRKIITIMLNIICFTVTLRIKFDYWKFFKEPVIVGSILIKLPSLRRKIRRLLAIKHI